MTHEPNIHKARPAPDFAQDAVSTCVHCHHEIKRVPGGDGPTWVHSHSGAVVGPGPAKIVGLADHVRAVRHSLIAISEDPAVCFEPDECSPEQGQALERVLDAWDDFEQIAGTAADQPGGVQS